MDQNLIKGPCMKTVQKYTHLSHSFRKTTLMIDYRGYNNSNFRIRIWADVFLVPLGSINHHKKFLIPGLCFRSGPG